MATRTTSTVWRSSSDAEFRAWGSWFSGCFSAFGWTASYSNFATGTNWTDVTAPAAANTARVTEVWAMADAAAATTPYFVKVEYGGASTVTIPAMRISIGTGHSGGGTLTGILYDSGATFLAVGASNANSLTHYASGDAGNIRISMATSGTTWVSSNTFCFSFTRRKNGSGVDQTTGALMAVGNSTTRRTQGFLAAAAAVAHALFGVPILFSTDGEATLDGKQSVCPLCYSVGPTEFGLDWVAVPSTTTHPVGTTFTVTILGASHTFIATQIGSLTTFVGTVGVLGMLYE